NREVLYLLARVVVIELARDARSLPFEQRRHGISERCLPAVPDMQPAGGIRGNEFDHDALAAELVAAPEALACREGVGDDSLPRCRRAKKIKQARACDLCPREAL